jgi:hypothetical protein
MVISAGLPGQPHGIQPLGVHAGVEKHQRFKQAKPMPKEL